MTEHPTGPRAPEAYARGRIGMWLFIGTEILLFGGLFLLYSAYRYDFAADFHAASRELSRLDGTLNTAILITSSLTVAIAVLALERGERRRAVAFLLATLALALSFLVVKGFEWGTKFLHGLYPRSATLLARPKGEILYIGLYFTMTGLHALHVIVGGSVLAVVAGMIRRGTVSAERPVILQNAGLFWHLVDIIWIFLFPLFYLIS